MQQQHAEEAVGRRTRGATARSERGSTGGGVEVTPVAARYRRSRFPPPTAHDIDIRTPSSNDSRSSSNSVEEHDPAPLGVGVVTKLLATARRQRSRVRSKRSRFHTPGMANWAGTPVPPSLMPDTSPVMRLQTPPPEYDPGASSDSAGGGAVGVTSALDRIPTSTRKTTDTDHTDHTSDSEATIEQTATSSVVKAGPNALRDGGGEADSTAMGSSTLLHCVVPGSSAFGAGAGIQATTAARLALFGYQAGASLAHAGAGDDVSLMGHRAAPLTRGNRISGFGSNVLSTHVKGDDVVALGDHALSQCVYGSHSLAAGSCCGRSWNQVHECTLLGSRAACAGTGVTWTGDSEPNEQEHDLLDQEAEWNDNANDANDATEATEATDRTSQGHEEEGEGGNGLVALRCVVCGTHAAANVGGSFSSHSSSSSSRGLTGERKEDRRRPRRKRHIVRDVTALGARAAQHAVLAQRLTAVGSRAGQYAAASRDCVWLGPDAGKHQSGIGNVAVGGDAASDSNHSGDDQVAVGGRALQFCSSGGCGQVGVGAETLRHLKHGSHNSASGWHAANQLDEGSRNVFHGADAGHHLRRGNGNVMLGADTGLAPTPTPTTGGPAAADTVDGCIVLGCGAKATESGQLVLGSTEFPLQMETLQVSPDTEPVLALCVVLNGISYGLPLLPWKRLTAATAATST